MGRGRVRQGHGVMVMVTRADKTPFLSLKEPSGSCAECEWQRQTWKARATEQTAATAPV